MIFISYRAESEEHSQKVRSFADKLKAEGLDVVLDQYYLEENRGGPDKGWPQWCGEHVKQAHRVVIIASPGWFEIFNGNTDQDQDSGYGAACEACIIRQELYDRKFDNPKHRIVSIGTTKTLDIPTELRGYQRYNSEVQNEFDNLIGWLKEMRQPIQSGFPQTIPSIPWPFANHFALREECCSLLKADSTRRVLLVQGESEFGKSSITKHLARLPSEIDFQWLKVGRLDFKGDSELTEELERCATMFNLQRSLDANQTPQRQLSTLLAELIKCSKPCLLVLDTFERIIDSPLGDWIEKTLILKVCNENPQCRLILTGQRIPDSSDHVWGNDSTTVKLEKPGEEHWVAYAKRFPSNPNPEFVRQAFAYVNGSPGNLSQFLCAGAAAK